MAQQDFIDYLMKGEAQPNATYDPVLLNRYNQPVQSSNVGSAFIPPYVPKSTGPIMNLGSAFAPSAPAPTAKIPAPRMNSTPALDNQQQKLEYLKSAKFPGSQNLNWGAAAQAAQAGIGVAETGRSDLIKAGQEYLKEVSGLPATQFVNPELYTAPAIKSQEEVKKNVAELNDLETKKIPITQEIYKKAEGDKKKIFTQLETDIQTTDEELAKIDEAIASLPPADAGRFWTNANTGSKILMGIGLALSAFNQEGIKNATNIITNSIDRDLEAQKIDLNRKLLGYKAKGENVKSRLQLYKEKFNNELAASEAAKADALALASLQVEAKKKNLVNAQSIAAADTTIAELKTKEAEAKTNAANALKEEKAKMAATKLKVAADASDASQKMAATYMDKAKILNDQLKAQGAFMAEQAKIKEEKKMSLAEKQRFDFINEGIKGLTDMRAALASGDWASRPGANNYKIGLKQYAEAYGRLNSQGVINKTEEENFKEMAPTLSDQLQDKVFGTNIVERKMKTMEDLFNGRMNTLLGK